MIEQLNDNEIREAIYGLPLDTYANRIGIIDFPFPAKLQIVLSFMAIISGITLGMMLHNWIEISMKNGVCQC